MNDVLVSLIIEMFKGFITQLEAKFIILPCIDYYFYDFGINLSFNLEIGNVTNCFLAS